MSTSSSHHHNLPTADDVHRWRLELDRIVVEEQEMRARHAAEEKALRDRRTRLEKLVTAGTAFVEVVANEPRPSEPMSAPAPAVPPEQTRRSKPNAGRERRKARPRQPSTRTWTATILRTLKSAGRGMTYGELKDGMARTHLGETLSRTEKALYGGVGKLADRGQIVKHNGRIYTPAAYRQFMADVAAGRAVDQPPAAASNRASDNKRAIIELLSRQLNGPTTAEIIDALYNSPPEGLTISPNKNVIYNLLSNMKKKEELILRDGRHYLPAQQDGSPGSSEPGDPKRHHGARGGSLSSSGNGSVPTSVAHPGANPAQPGE